MSERGDKAGSAPAGEQERRGQDAAPSARSVRTGNGRIRPISDTLTSDIRVMRGVARQVQDQLSSPRLKALLNGAIAELDEIPHLFDSEVAMRQALMLPSRRILRAMQAKAINGTAAIR